MSIVGTAFATVVGLLASFILPMLSISSRL